MAGSNRSLIITTGCLVLVILASVYLYVDAGSIGAPGRRPGQIGPDAWPRAILLILMFCCVVKIVDLWKHQHSRKQESVSPGQAREEAEAGNPKVLIAGVIMVFGFVLATDTIGFFLSSLLFLWGLTYLGGWKKKLYLVPISVLGTVAISYIFVKLVYIPLPKGTGFFEDVSILVYRTLGIF